MFSEKAGQCNLDLMDTLVCLVDANCRSADCVKQVKVVLQM